MKRTLASVLLLAALGVARPVRAEDEPEPEPAPATSAPAAKPSPRPVLRVDGGYGRRWLFGLPFSGGDVGFAAGMRPPGTSHAIWGTARFGTGTTESGLWLWTLRVGFEAEGILLERLRLGLGISPALAVIPRETRDASIVGFGFEGRATLRLDLVQTDDVAFFLRGIGEAMPMLRGDGILLGASGGLGLDFDVGPARRARRP